MGWLEGKVALVTGGAGGIGAAVVRRFLAEGARVGALDRSAAGLRELAASCGSADLVTVPGDVTRLADHKRAVATVVERFGRLDVFVGNAGIFDGFASLAEIPEADLETAFDQVVAVNVKGYLFGAKAALPELLKTGGNMIFTVSNAAFYPDGGGPIYTASKHAALGLIRQLAFELAPRIRVNGVAPGGTVTGLSVAPALRGVVAARPHTVSREEKIRSRNPLGLVMRPEDHTGAYVLLASDQARAITGDVIESDGGIGVRGCGGQRA